MAGVHPEKGVDGGMDTPLNEADVFRGEERTPIEYPHIPTEMKPGDVLVTRCGGGCGSRSAVGKRSGSGKGGRKK